MNNDEEVARLRARVDELLAEASALENNRRGWKARAESMSKLLTATLIEMRVHGGEKEKRASALVTEVAERANMLEADAWCEAVAVARDFVKEAEKQEDLSAFVQEWTARFKAALG